MPAGGPVAIVNKALGSVTFENSGKALSSCADRIMKTTRPSALLTVCCLGRRACTQALIGWVLLLVRGWREVNRRPARVLHVLLRADSTRDHLSPDVGGTGQTATLRGHVEEQKTVFICLAA